MKGFSRVLIPFLLSATMALLGMIFSHHGLLELRSFERVVHDAQARADQLETENRVLKHRADLLAHPSRSVMERVAREVQGWARPGEVVYLDPISK